MSNQWSVDQEQRLSGWLGRIPGYAGYRDKESRRDADRHVREGIGRDLSAAIDRVEVVARGLADQRRIMDVGQVDTLARDLRYFRDRVMTATYGYGGIFSDRPVDEGVLDQIRLFDEAIGKQVERLGDTIGGIETAAGPDQLRSALAPAEMAVRELQHTFDTRAEVVQSGQPANQQAADAALAVLQTKTDRAATQKPGPAYDLRDRDALSVEGENYIVDSRIALTGAGFDVRLFRIATAPDRWLFVPAAADQPLGLLEAVADKYIPGAPLVSGGKQFVTGATGTAAGDTSGPGGSSGRRAVTYTVFRGAENPTARAVVLDWGTQQLVLIGREVHPDDVEIYGSTSGAHA